MSKKKNKEEKSYGLGRFILDFLLVIFTGTLYGWYLLFKFLKKNS